jgi:hypothetical protein
VIDLIDCIISLSQFEISNCVDSSSSACTARS